jgi:hypothetical protein
LTAKIKSNMIMGVSSGELEIGDNWQTKSKQWAFDGSQWINLDSDVLLKQNCHTQNIKRTIIYGATFNLSSSFFNHTWAQGAWAQLSTVVLFLMLNIIITTLVLIVYYSSFNFLLWFSFIFNKFVCYNLLLYLLINSSNI